MIKTIQAGDARLVCADSLRFIKTLPDNSIDLIATDPPYYAVKPDSWDNQWPSEAAFLAWLEDVIDEFARVLKPTGSLYLFCGHALSAHTELLIRKRLNVLNHIVWAKPTGQWNKNNKERLRKFFPATERIIFAEHHSNTSTDPASTGYLARCEEVRREVFRPLMDYFINARAALNVGAADINRATGTQMCSHWFSPSQWHLPPRKHYEALSALFRQRAAEQNQPPCLQTDYDTLAHQYKALLRVFQDRREELETERRFFSVTKDVPYTDVWSFAPVHYYPGKHPCEKPADLNEHIIRSSSRPGDLVADFFMGSGSMVKAALKLGRRVIGVEMGEEIYNDTAQSVAAFHAALAD